MYYKTVISAIQNLKKITFFENIFWNLKFFVGKPNFIYLYIIVKLSNGFQNAKQLVYKKTTISTDYGRLDMQKKLLEHACSLVCNYRAHNNNNTRRGPER